MSRYASLIMVPNDVLNMSPVMQTVPQDVPNSNMVLSHNFFAPKFYFHNL